MATLLPIFVFAQIILIPGLNTWVDTFTVYDNIILHIMMSEKIDYFNPTILTLMLNVVGAPIILIYIFVRIVKCSFGTSRWITKKLHLTPVMNLVLFRNDKQFYELKVY